MANGKFLIKANDNYYSLTLFKQLGKPKDNVELERWYKGYGIDNISDLIKIQHIQSIPMQLDKNDTYKTAIQIDFNEITDKIEYVNGNDKKEIKYNTEEYQLLDLIKKNIGSKFQIGKWEENKGGN